MGIGMPRNSSAENGKRCANNLGALVNLVIGEK
mgnify:CR=1 FL=1